MFISPHFWVRGSGPAPQVLHAHGYALDELWQDTPLTKAAAAEYEMVGGLATASAREAFENATGQAVRKRSKKLCKWIQGDNCFRTRLSGETPYVGLAVKEVIQQMSSSSSSSSSSNNSSGVRDEVQNANGHLGVTLRQLLQHAVQRTWHKSSEQANVALRALALHMVLQAHGYQLAGLPDRDAPVKLEAGQYTMYFCHAAVIASAAIAAQLPNTKKQRLSKLLDDCPYFEEELVEASEYLKLNITQLVVPQQRAAAQQVVAKLQPLLEDEGIVKVVHDGRQDAEILHRDFGVTVKGSLDTQLLAGLAGLGAASSSGDNTQPDTTTAANSSWSDCIRRMRLNELSLLYGYAYTDVPSHKRGGTAGWLQRPLPPRAVAYAAGDVRYLLVSLPQKIFQVYPAAACCDRTCRMMTAAG
ncbi:hypothetical protein OEZ86_009179 [Tetradesmus obliquus]|nr:hypothetical protein OEZ86_009179 [Tetradesmus obliquus]